MRKVKISEARKLLQEAAVKDGDVVEAAIQAVEQYGIGQYAHVCACIRSAFSDRACRGSGH